MTKRTPPVTGGRDPDGGRVRPTLVLNAETVWRIFQIQQYGPTWFRSFGTASQPGPRLVTIHGHVHTSGVLETQAGVRLSSLLDAAGVVAPDSPVLLGGLAGAFLTSAQAASVTWSDDDLARHGARTGAAVIEVLDPLGCPLEHLTRMLTYAAAESAGQCGPCMFGLPALSADVVRLVARPDARRLAEVEERLRLLRDRGACRFPDGVSTLTASALDVFADHLAVHAHHGCDRRGAAAHTGSHRALAV